MKPIYLLSIALLTSLAASAAGIPLVINAEQSHIDYDVKVTVGSFTGHLDRFDAKVLMSSDSVQVEKAVITFRFGDVKTGEAERDKHMNEWQETEQFPDARFDLVSLVADAAAGGRYSAVGNFTMHGKKQMLSFPVSVLTEGQTIVIDGTVPLDVRDYGLPVIRKFIAMKVHPIVTVHFHLQGSVPVAE